MEKILKYYLVSKYIDFLSKRKDKNIKEIDLIGLKDILLSHRVLTERMYMGGDFYLNGSHIDLLILEGENRGFERKSERIMCWLIGSYNGVVFDNECELFSNYLNERLI